MCCSSSSSNNSSSVLPFLQALFGSSMLRHTISQAGAAWAGAANAPGSRDLCETDSRSGRVHFVVVVVADRVASCNVPVNPVVPSQQQASPQAPESGALPEVNAGRAVELPDEPQVCHVVVSTALQPRAQLLVSLAQRKWRP